MTYSTGTMVFNGSKSLGVDIVDKAIVNAEGTAPEKQVYLIKGTGPVTLTSGRIGGGVDSDGYPTTLEGNSLTKQGAALEKYLGTWRSCVASGNGSEEEILTLTKATDSSAYFSWTKTSYSSSTHCSGMGLGSETEGGFLLEGTKNIGTETVDKVIISANLRPMQKQVFLIKGTGPVTLTPGRIDGGLDADGYPTTLDSSFLTKQ